MPAFRSAVQRIANPHMTASQATVHVVQRHPILEPAARPLSSLQILTCSFFSCCCSPRSTWPSDALAHPSLVHVADGEATTCFLSVHHCPHLVTRSEAARRLVWRFGCVWIRSLRRRLTRARRCHSRTSVRARSFASSFPP